ncbi:hypothetical protein F383_33996 [Gossypium arboreum]|uniref:Uncharacterized protein n=1 Tax=Gossypium arboreum TaxID=29729 RepID=A0A0B0PSP9_GOSAR|nr:hypothetical protein F383_33996 [Gossypium arboreum]
MLQNPQKWPFLNRPRLWLDRDTPVA